MPCAPQTVISCEQAGPGCFTPALAATRASTTREHSLGSGKFRAVPARPGLATRHFAAHKCCESRLFGGVLIVKSLRLRGPAPALVSAMSFRRLASSSQPHNLTLPEVIARKSSSLTSTASVDCPPNSKVWVATREPNWSRISVFCVSSRTSPHRHHPGRLNAGGR